MLGSISKYKETGLGHFGRRSFTSNVFYVVILWFTLHDEFETNWFNVSMFRCFDCYSILTRYFELIAVMRVPEDFPRVFLVNAPLQLALYLFVACTGYYYQGAMAEGYFLDNLPKGELYRLASILLYAHVVVV